MVYSALILITLGILIVAAWYVAFRGFNRRLARRVLQWLEGAVVAHGEISNVEWLTPSHFRARLRLPGCGFQHPSLEARLAPREKPWKWALWKWRGRKETFVFEANLACPPHHSLEVGRTRYTGLTRRWMRNTQDWPTYPLASLFISTQPEWEPEISSRMTTVVAEREFEFITVSFRPRAPHFSVTFALSELVEHSGGELEIFDSLRELAESSPTSRM
jgi:hypothetical protein